MILTWSSQGLHFNSLVLHNQPARKQGMKKHLPGSKRRWNLLLAHAEADQDLIRFLKG